MSIVNFIVIQSYALTFSDILMFAEIKSDENCMKSTQIEDLKVSLDFNEIPKEEIFELFKGKLFEFRLVVEDSKKCFDENNLKRAVTMLQDIEEQPECFLYFFSVFGMKWVKSHASGKMRCLQTLKENRIENLLLDDYSEINNYFGKKCSVKSFKYAQMFSEIFEYLEDNRLICEGVRHMAEIFLDKAKTNKNFDYFEGLFSGLKSTFGMESKKQDKEVKPASEPITINKEKVDSQIEDEVNKDLAEEIKEKFFSSLSSLNLKELLFCAFSVLPKNMNLEKYHPWFKSENVSFLKKFINSHLHQQFDCSKYGKSVFQILFRFYGISTGSAIPFFLIDVYENINSIIEFKQTLADSSASVYSGLKDGIANTFGSFSAEEKVNIVKDKLHEFKENVPGYLSQTAEGLNKGYEATRGILSNAVEFSKENFPDYLSQTADGLNKGYEATRGILSNVFEFTKEKLENVKGK